MGRKVREFVAVVLFAAILLSCVFVGFDAVQADREPPWLYIPLGILLSTACFAIAFLLFRDHRNC